MSNEVYLDSPTANVRVTIKIDDASDLRYSVHFNGSPAIENSRLGIVVDSIDWGEGVRLGKPIQQVIDETYKTRGVHDKAVNRCNETRLPVIRMENDARMNLILRAYDDGLAIRYEVPGSSDRKVIGDRTEWRFPRGSTAWYHTKIDSYEGYHRQAAIESVVPETVIGPPMTVELPDGAFAAVTEANLRDFSGMTLKAIGDRLFRAHFVFDQEGWMTTGTVRTPWRVVMLSENLNGLVNSDIVTNLNPPPASELAEANWIRTGRAVWSWWSEGNAIDPARQLWYVDRAAELDFEHCLVDAGWEGKNWHTDGKDHWAVLKKLVTYGRERGVAIWVWRNSKGLRTPEEREQFFSRCAEAGVAGVKLDFINSESRELVDWYIAILEEAARHRLMINFHGANKPTGLSRTFPNEMTREGVWGLEHVKYKWGGKVSARHNATLPFTRLLAGHADYTPCTLDPEKLRGTSFAHQLATAIVMTSPVTHWADNPKHYLDSRIENVLKSIPAVWDRTRVLNGSKIGEEAAFARKNGDEWFLGILNGGDEKVFQADLSFLGDDVYRGVLLSDDPYRPDSFLRSEMIVSGNEVLDISMRHGGGAVAHFTKTSNCKPEQIRISPSGGISTAPIRVVIEGAPKDVVVRFTLDGSDVSATSPIYDDPFVLDESATVRAQVFCDAVPGFASSEAAFTILPFRQPDRVEQLENGLKYEYFEKASEQKWNRIPEFSELASAKEGLANSFDFSTRNRDRDFAYRFRGYIDVPRDGIYNFYTRSEDGSRLFIGDELIVDNDGRRHFAEAHGLIALKSGPHPITVTYCHPNEGDIGVEVLWKVFGENKAPLPQSAFRRPK